MTTDTEHARPARRWRPRIFIALFLVAMGLAVSIAWGLHAPTDDFNPGAMIGEKRSGPQWAMQAAEWTGNRTILDLLVESSEATLASERCNDDDLRRLSRLRKLTALRIEGTCVTEEGLRSLSNVSHLEHLQLVNVPISERGLENLERFPHLKRITLAGHTVTDSHLHHLQRIRTLECVELMDTQTTPAGRNGLAEALPDCQITVLPIKIGLSD